MDRNALANLKNMRVLYVEDDPITRECLAQMIAPWVKRLDVAGDGEAGLNCYSQGRQDIVVTDLGQAGMDSLTMSAEIRRLSPQQLILMLSGQDQAEYLYRSIELGISQFLTKPVGIERLLERMDCMASSLLAQRERARDQQLLEQYRRLLNAQSMVSTWGTDGRLTFANDRLAQLTGHDPASLMGMAMQGLSPADEPDAGLEAAWRDVLTGKQWSGVTRARKRDGGELRLESTLVPILDESGQVDQVLRLDVELTDPRARCAVLSRALGHSERVLRQQRQRLAALGKALDMGTCVCAVDHAGHVLDANHHLANRLGLAEGEMRGMPLADFAPAANLVLARHGGQGTPAPWSQVLAWRHKDGAELWFSVVFVPAGEDGEQEHSMILVCQDISESLELTRELMDTQRDLLGLVNQVVENRSMETGGHVKRVGEIARLMAMRYGLDQERAEMIRVAAPLHDVGKVGIPDAILHKQARLDAAEFEVMKAHARMGYEILSRIDRPMVRMAALIAHEHHEHFDGLGYPRGLTGEHISIEGRIVALADVLDALAHERSYKPAWDDEAIHAYLREERGRKFDPLLVDLALAGWDDIGAIRARYRDD